MSSDPEKQSKPQWRLECKDVCVSVGSRRLLEKISLTICAGECVSIIGPNGAGKTTLLLALMGIRQPTSGEIRLDGAALARLSSRSRGRFAALVPQALEHAGGLTVREVVATGRFPHLRPLHPLSLADEQRIDQVLGECGIAKLADRPLAAISGGERQKTLLAAAIAQDARAIFLDEPDTALDPAYQVELVRLLRREQSAGRTLVLVSHDLQFPTALSGRVLALCEGRCIADGPAEQVLTSESLVGIYGTGFEAFTTRNGRRVFVPDF